MLRFPVARSCPEPSFSPPSFSVDDRLTTAELRAEALLREAARGVRPGRVQIDEVVADLGPEGAPLFSVSLAVCNLDGDDPCLSLCRLCSQLLARLKLHLEGAGL
ncbi:MAG: hypothetical protein HY000_13175 [Planctomycetes bacterium]|nr:hypothetical protein [Planctomycetota bacterium]